MPLPARYSRPVQAIVKMVNAPELSLRGGQRPTWQSREGTSSSYKVPIKTHQPIASVAASPLRGVTAIGSCKFPGTLGDCTRHCRGADSRARRNAADPYRPSLKWYALPNCHCEGASRPWQSREGTCSPYRPSLKWYALPNCHCEEANGRRGNLGKALAVRTDYR